MVSQYLTTLSNWGACRRPLPVKGSCSVYPLVSDQSCTVKTLMTEGLLIQDRQYVLYQEVHGASGVCHRYIHIDAASDAAVHWNDASMRPPSWAGEAVSTYCISQQRQRSIND